MHIPQDFELGPIERPNEFDTDWVLNFMLDGLPTGR